MYIYSLIAYIQYRHSQRNTPPGLPTPKNQSVSAKCVAGGHGGLRRSELRKTFTTQRRTSCIVALELVNSDYSQVEELDWILVLETVVCFAVKVDISS